MNSVMAGLHYCIKVSKKKTLTALCAALIVPLASASIEVTGGSIERGGIQNARIEKPHFEGPQVRIGVNGISVEKPHIVGPKVRGPKVVKPHVTAPEITIKPGIKKH